MENEKTGILKLKKILEESEKDSYIDNKDTGKKSTTIESRVPLKENGTELVGYTMRTERIKALTDLYISIGSDENNHKSLENEIIEELRNLIKI